MNLIQQITNDSFQKQNLILQDGTTLSMTLYFVPMQYAWFITELSYQPSNFVLNGLRVTNYPNMLQQWKNILPFGLGCFSTQDREPSQQQDFSSGASKLYILTSEEVEEFTEFLARG